MTRTADEILDELTEQTGIEKQELMHLIEGIAVFFRKGYSLEESMEKSQGVWLSAIKNVSEMTPHRVSEIVTEMFFPSK